MTLYLQLKGIFCTPSWSQKGRQGIIQEFNLGIGFHMSITLWRELCSRGVCSPPRFCYISLLDSLTWNTFFLTIYSNFFILNFSLNVLLPYSSYCFPYFYLMKTVCSCWSWKLSNNACSLNLLPSGSFLTQSNWLEKKVDQSLCVRKEALGTRLMSTKIMVRC